jgi:GWxTD domain-containing protein
MKSFVRAGFVLALLAVLQCAAAAQAVKPTVPLSVTADIYRFRGGDDEHVLVEVAYAFPERALTYRPDSAGLAGGGAINILVFLRDSLISNDGWITPHRVPDTSSFSRGMNLVGLHKLELAAGDYVLRVLVRDRFAPERRDSLTVRLPIRVFSTASPVLSDLEFASVIRQGSPGGIFYKNTLDVVPNVGGMFSEDQRCNYYIEAYNLTAGQDTGQFVVRTTVLDAVGKEIIARDRPRKRVGESSVIVDNIPVKNLRTGTYSMFVSLLDREGKPANSSSRKLYVYNATLGVDSSLLRAASSLPMPQYMSMDESEVDREFQWCRYVAMDDEKSQWPSLKGVDAKRRFMSDFWRQRGAGVREEYLSRVAYANTNYRVLSRDGYRTDRGRVMIIYGQPDDVDRHPNETEMRPYEVWSYNNIQGGVIFVFVLRNAAGDYELVHSTHRDELHDENWDRVGVSR